MFENLTYNQSTIHFGILGKSQFEEILTEDFADAKKVIITDENVYHLWIQDLTTNYPELANAEIIQIPAGEEYKSIDVCTQIWSALSEYQIGRNDLIINFGGGVITDIGGFVASCFKRGLKFINIPTTLLSMVDASVGGKTGVDLGPYKNQIGVFSDAEHVFIDDRYLETLPNDELKSGYAEMLKHGLIADKSYWNDLREFDPVNTENYLEFIYRSVLIKKRIVEKDSKESGLRKVLNFGHTIGHGLEGFCLKNDMPVLHGYAVASGMLAEAYISCEKALISKQEYDDIRSTLSQSFSPVHIADNDFKEVIKLMHNDKKNKGGVIQFSLINGIGKCLYDQEANDKLVLNALESII
ncbi:MAG: 3-dehydroquinate synthase [Crocinitomicaceae bacterium]|nr:3-dehydroquinate synthase [Crocinitomicaceae bacterium]